MYIFAPHLRSITIFVLTYYAFFTTWALSIKNYEFLLYEAEMLALMILVVFMDKRVQFSRLVLYLLASWGALHLAGGLVPIPDSLADMNDADPNAAFQVLYNMRPWDSLPRYDNVIHALGFGTCALATREALQAHLGKPVTMNVQMGFVVFLIALGLGAVNEIIEFAAVLLIPNTNVGGYTNTLWDLVSNAVGAGIAITYMKLKE